jgi:hypothetical protein
MKNLSMFALYLAGWFGLRSLFPKFFAARSYVFWCITLSILLCHALAALPDLVSLVNEEFHFHMHRYQRLQRTWYCGSGDVNSHVAGVWASVFAGRSLHEVNECCYAHDLQYDQCLDRDSPDAEFRQCLVNACDEDDFVCSVLVSQVFAAVVDYMGFIAFSQECGLDWVYATATK